MLHYALYYIRALVALRILPCGTLPAVLQQGLCYIKHSYISLHPLYSRIAWLFAFPFTGVSHTVEHDSFIKGQFASRN